MVGILITTHGNLGEEMIKAMEMIKGGLKGVMHLSMDQTKSADELKKEIATAIKKLDQGQGVLILTDLFGGTPSNIALSFLKQSKVEVVTGVNLPMLLKLSELKENMSLMEVATTVKEYGIKNIYLASEILNKKITP